MHRKKKGNLKIGIILQARMMSTRLPGKVLKEIIDGKSILELILERLSNVKSSDKLIIATSRNQADNKIEELLKKKKYEVFRGSENNVLERFYKAAKQWDLDVIARCNADCPLIDPSIVELVIDNFLKNDIDYCSNILRPSYPVGMHTEVFSFEALKKAKNQARDPLELEHVTPFIYRNPELFKLMNVSNKDNLSKYRLTLVYQEDLLLIKEVFSNFYKKDKNFSVFDVVNFLKENPKIYEINSHISKDGTV